MNSSFFSKLVFLHVCSLLIAVIFSFIDLYGFYSKEWEIEFSIFVGNSGGDYPYNIEAPYRYFLIFYLLVYALSIYGMARRNIWSIYLFVCSFLFEIVFSIFYHKNIYYSDKFVYVSEYIHSITSGSILIIILTMYRDVGFSSKNEK